MKDTKGIRQVLEELAKGWEGWAFDQLDGTSFIKGELESIEQAKDKAEAALQEIMLGMLPEKLEEWQTIPSGQTVQNKDAHNFNAAINIIEQNIRGGFNNG